MSDDHDKRQPGFATTEAVAVADAVARPTRAAAPVVSVAAPGTAVSVASSNPAVGAVARIATVAALLSSRRGVNPRLRPGVWLSPRSRRFVSGVQPAAPSAPVAIPFPFAADRLFIGDVGIVDDGAGKVDQWQDQSGNGVHLNENAATYFRKPDVGTPPFGVALVNPAGNLYSPLYRANNADFFSAGGTTWLAFVVEWSATPPDTGYLIDGTRFDVAVLTDGSVRFRTRWGFSQFTATTAAGQAVAGKNLIQVKLVGDAFLHIRVNGNAWITPVAAAITGLGGHVLTVGCANNGSWGFPGTLGLVAALLGSVPTAQQEQDLFTYVNAKFGTALTYS